MKRYLLLVLCTMLVNFVAIGEELISISGRVVDSRSNAMPQVSVRTVRGSIATVTNGDGVFSLKLPLLSGADSVRFSSAGYNSEVVAVSDIESQQGRVVVKLGSANVAIESIQIELKDATSYIEEVFDRSEFNHPLERSYQSAFYREMIKKRGSFATLSEAVIEIDKSGFRSRSADRVAIYKGRSLRDQRFTDTLFVKIQGGITSAMYLDVAKHSDIVFGETPREIYRFWFNEPTTIDGRRMMVVSFNQRSEDPNVFDYRGNIFVDSLTMGIARVEFNCNVEGRDNSISVFIKKKPRGIDVKATQAKYVSSYRFLHDKWHLDYCSIDLGFRCHYKRRLFRTNYNVF